MSSTEATGEHSACLAGTENVSDSANEHPLGPLWTWRAAQDRFSARLLAAGILVGCAGIFLTARQLTPQASGIGSHTQLGLAPCSMPVLLGIPCPTCGMTTSFAHFVRGNLFASFHAQPAGFLIAIAVLGVAILSGVTLVRGRILSLNWYRIPPWRVAVMLLAVFLFGWGYKLVVGIESAR